MNRRFSGNQKAALVVVSGGKCEQCGADLQPGWHADHITPYSAGGPTTLANGAALCPACNIAKGGGGGDDRCRYGNADTSDDGLREWQRFADFVTTQPLEGLGFSLDLVKSLCRGDVEAMDALDQATANPNGTNRYSSSVESTELETPPAQTTPGTLRRLRKDAPDLHARVLGGELSPHAAAVEAGFRPKRVSVRIDDSASAARTLARAWGDRLGELIAELESLESRL